MAYPVSGQVFSPGYPSGQDGAILPTLDYALCPVRNISPKAI